MAGSSPARLAQAATDPITSDFDAQLTAAERSLVERAAEFGRRVVAPQSRHWEHDGRHPTETLRQACAARLAAAELPSEQGGHGFRFSATLRIVEELAKHDFGFAFSLVNHHNATVRVARAGGPIAARLVPQMIDGHLIGCGAFTDPEHGSDLAGLTMTARKVDGGWRLDGEKAWITNAAVAGVITTLAQTNAGSGSAGLATFVVEADRPGFTRHPPFDTPGIRAIGVGGFRLDEYVAPEEALIDPPGSGFSMALSRINAARAYVAAMCAGMLESSIALATRYAARRQAFGQPILDFQGLRWSLVDADTDLAALRLLAYHAARQIDAGAAAEEAAARAKKFAAERTLPHISACVQAMGARGLLAEYPLMRHLAACKAASFADGSTEMMNERLGKSLARRHLSTEAGG
jgi:alkylation response protein AidB-like acyl-CoA dehydrogenase